MTYNNLAPIFEKINCSHFRLGNNSAGELQVESN